MSPHFPSNRAILISLLSGLSLLISACEKRLPNPEMMDPIFQDLNAQLSQAQSTVTELTAELEEAKKELERAAPQTGDRTRAFGAVAGTKDRLERARQKELYLEIKRDQRLSEDRKNYAKAFESKSKWPPDAEFHFYMASKRLQEASRKWDDRVPKSREVAGKRPAEPEKKASGGGH